MKDIVKSNGFSAMRETRPSELTSLPTLAGRYASMVPVAIGLFFLLRLVEWLLGAQPGHGFATQPAPVPLAGVAHANGTELAVTTMTTLVALVYATAIIRDDVGMIRKLLPRPRMIDE
jgi:hypothetical protein